MSEFLQANWTSLATLGIILLLFFLLRNRATRVSGGLDEILGNGQPVIVEVFSNT
jgi:hypothetical protein